MEINKKSPLSAITKFSKEQILKSKKYDNRCDILTVVLEENKSYTHSEIEEKIKIFLEEGFDDNKEVKK